jgi:putative oxidoreductase
MTDMPAAARPASGVVQLVRGAIALMERIPYSLLAFVARVAAAGVFWQSGRTKIDGWRVNDTAILLFREEFKLPVIEPVLAAHLATYAEHFFPALLVLGLATRFAALALLIMTLVIQIFVYPLAWPTHGVWAACFLLIMMRGPGLISLDHLIAERFK